MEIHLDNDVFYAEENDVVVINPDVLHNIIPLTDSVTYDCIIVDKNFFDDHGFLFNNVHIKEIIRDKEVNKNICNIKELVICKKSKYYVAEIFYCLLDMFISIFKKHSVEKESTQGFNNSLAIVEKGIEYIHKYFNDNITIDDVCGYSGYSKFHFCRCFREITGYTVVNYINMQKIKYAKTMLEKGNMTVNEIAEVCGFNSTTYFATVFKKIAGLSPSEIKRMNKKSF